MERPISKSATFVSGAARFKDLIYIIAKDRGLAKNDVPHSRFIGFDQLKFGHMGDRNWNAVAICVAKKPSERMIAVGEDGEVFTYAGGNHTEEQISPEPSVLRNVGVIAGQVFACGMKRQVYRRTGEGVWVALHAPAPNQGQNAGFEAICGTTDLEVYAAGWNGEIWEWDGSRWHNHVSPTNLILTGACCAGDQDIYICGQHGMLLCGRHAQWDVLNLGGFEEDFWDVHWFNDKLYLATMTGLYTYSGNVFEPVNFGDDAAATCYRLTDAEGVLWSVGASDVFAFDGSNWSRID